MPHNVQRGFVESDKIEFGSSSMQVLIQAQDDICMLLLRGYDIEKCITFVGNHYCLSVRQRNALIRATANPNTIKIRKQKEQKGSLKGQTLHIDGFNLIITLEVALSNSSLLLCMDGLVRDIAGLHGTYRLIDKTKRAIALIGETLEEAKVEKAIFYLDSPVSNSGRLCHAIVEELQAFSFQTQAELVQNADVCLRDKDNVVTGDAIIINECKSYVNLSRRIIEERIPGFSYINLSGIIMPQAD